MKFTQHALILLLSLMALALSCGGWSTEEATAQCEEERERLQSCFDAAAMEQCIACHEDCGGDCSLVIGQPCVYSCD
jgi:hypothetical protein